MYNFLILGIKQADIFLVTGKQVFFKEVYSMINNFTLIRQLAELKQYEAAKELGLGKVFINRLESGTYSEDTVNKYTSELLSKHSNKVISNISKVLELI